MENILYVAVLGLNQSWDASQLSEPKAVKSLAANFCVHVINASAGTERCSQFQLL